MCEKQPRVHNRAVIVTLLMGLSIFYIEYIAYEIESFGWPIQKCLDCVTLLLVADPQIIGYQNENYLGSSWAVWDSDRYLKKTFSRAFKKSQPDIIVFLGDIMDEGHIASQEEFQKYEERIRYIFNTSDNIMKIYLPGDNDIGGEEDLVSPLKHERFMAAYGRQDSLMLDNINFVKVNRLTETIPVTSRDDLISHRANITRVVFSHLPLLSKPGSFVDKVIDQLSPKIIFTAHDHMGTYINKSHWSSQPSHIQILPTKNFLTRLRLDPEDVHELQIPTCSYRMGTLSMGYGLAHIDSNGEKIDFTILWLPNRFFQLLFYLVGLVFGLLLSLWTIYTTRYRTTYRWILV